MKESTLAPKDMGAKVSHLRRCERLCLKTDMQDEANRMSATDAFMHPFSADLSGADYTLVRGSPEVQRSVSDPFLPYR